MKRLEAPEGFLWGAATSAYQVEGSPLADGAGPSIWHRFSHTPGRTHDGDHGDVACDQYRRWPDDVALMRDLGLRAYRFSIAWGRVMPDGRGRVNPDGLAYYDRLVDGLLEAGIQPVVTLYHWDLPAALDDRGGWLNPDIAGWFADYTAAMVRALDDRVRLWATLNEPWVVMDGGYLNGGLAPGHRNLYEAPIVSHNLLRAHAEGVRAYRAEGRHQVGLVVNLEPQYPATDREEDRAAARRVDAHMNRHYLDPVFRGHYPPELAEIYGDAWPGYGPDDLVSVTEPIDFLGVNYYTRRVTRYEAAAPPLYSAPVRQPDRVYTEMEWEVSPSSFRDVLDWLADRYGGIPMYITENGAAFPDPETAAGDLVEDPQRVAYYRSHIRTVLEAAEAGVPIRGYFAWSLLDNFEWSHGYSKRFGIVHVDFETQRRTLKASARFYADIIASNGAVATQDDGS
jgi:beta-glucosidase